MFQKENSSIGSKNDVPLGKKDKKKLRDVAIQQFPLDAGAPIDKIFMEGSISVRKVQHEKLGKVQLYYKNPNATADGDAFWPYSKTTQCIWMSIDVGPNQFHHAPTLALLSVVPNFPTIVVPHNVSKFVCRGAHLMRAGIHQGCLPDPLPSVVAVRVHGNPQPFGVGQVTAKTSADTVGPGTQGVGVEIWTSYGDDLWKTTNSHPPKSLVGLVVNEHGGAPFDNGHYGNVGFLDGKMVRPIMAIYDDEDDYDDNDDNDDNEKDDQTGDAARTTLVDGTNPSSGFQDNGQPPTEDNEDQDVENGDAPSISIESLALSDVNDPTASLPTVDPLIACDAPILIEPTRDDDDDENPEDVLLHQAVCKALVNLKDKELPMATSIFYANHVLPSRRPDTNIELKKTSWKKFGPYLLEMQRDELLMLSPDKDKNPAGFIKGINRQHLDLRGIKKETVVDPNGKKSKLSIVTLYIIPNHFVALMGLNVDDVKAANAKNEDRRGTGFLTQPEVRAILDHYLTSNELLNRGDVTVDAPLTAALFKKDPNPPTSTSRKDLNDGWIRKMEEAYALVEMPGSKILKLKRGSPPKVLVEVEKRQNKKFITRVRGVEEYGINAEDFCRDVAKRFACSGAVETDVGRRAALKKNQVELVFQGNLVEELRALLVGDERLSTHGGVKGSDYCVPKQSIEVDLKKGVPIKKSR